MILSFVVLSLDPCGVVMSVHFPVGHHAADRAASCYLNFVWFQFPDQIAALYWDKKVRRPYSSVRKKKVSAGS